jgi:hypothetical protein
MVLVHKVNLDGRYSPLPSHAHADWWVAQIRRMSTGIDLLVPIRVTSPLWSTVKSLRGMERFDPRKGSIVRHFKQIARHDLLLHR